MKRLLLLLGFLLALWPVSASAQVDVCRFRTGTTCLMTAAKVQPQTTDVAALGDSTHEFLSVFVKNITIGTGGQFLGTVGCTTPPFAFTGDLTTGFCRSSAGEWSLYSGNTQALKGTSTTVTALGVFSVTGHTIFEGVTSTGATGTGKLVYDASPTISGHPTIEGVLSTGATGTGKFMFDASPTITGHPTVEGILSTGATGTGKFVFDASPTITGHATVEGVTATGATGTGKFVFDTAPTFTTSATAPTINATTGYQANGAAGITGTCDTPAFVTGLATVCNGAGGSVDGNYKVASNFATDGASTALQNITGLSWTFPANTALSVPFRCSLVYSQATAAVSDSIGIQDVTVAPTNALLTGSAETALGTTAYGDVTALAATTATAVVTFTPSAIGTTFNVYIDGFIEQPSNGSTSAFNVMIKTTTAADIITIYRGSYCKVG